VVGLALQDAVVEKNRDGAARGREGLVCARDRREIPPLRRADSFADERGEKRRAAPVGMTVVVPSGAG